MSNLPEVNDDFKNILQTVKMMNIPDENIYAEKNIKFDKVKEIYLNLTYTIIARTKSLTENTGIFGS